MEQRSEEWFSARKGRITGSMAGAALGLDPNCTRDEAMRRMVRAYQGLPSEFVGNIATQWGQSHEEEAREAFEYHTGLETYPASFIVHPQETWIGASPDRFVSDDALLEIKCPFGLRDHQNPVFKTAAEQRHYMVQMQVQMYVTERTKCYFWQWSPFGYQIDDIAYDPAMIADIMPKLHAFYQEFLSICDEPLEGASRELLDTPALRQKLAEYDDLAKEIEAAEARRKVILGELIAVADGNDAVICGRKLTKVEKAGSVSYAAAIKELAPNADLEKWRGKPSSYWMFK
jgi:putative phage-type endonuclease